MKTAEIRIDLFVRFVRESIGQWSWFGGVDGFRATTPPKKGSYARGRWRFLTGQVPALSGGYRVAVFTGRANAEADR